MVAVVVEEARVLVVAVVFVVMVAVAVPVVVLWRLPWQLR